MELKRLIEELSLPRAYPHPAPSVVVRQTHISAVFLAGGYVYKVKKPVSLGFLDFSTLARRLHFCEEEVRLNRRLAPSVYLGVVPITAAPGGLCIEGEGEPIEYAVKMLRLPDEAQLRQLLEGDRLGRDLVIALARRLAAFHRTAAASAEITAAASFEAVRRNLLDNMASGESQVGRTVTRAVLDRLRDLTEAALADAGPQIEERAAQGYPRDVHGDLHLDHVYHFPDQQPPDDLVIVDCIEFSPRLRYIDPVADIAFLAMDLGFRGRPDLAHDFAEAYFEAAHDDRGRDLLALYASYRSAVRAKVNGIGAGEAEIAAEERLSLATQGRAHWLYALGELEEPRLRPALVIVGGLPGTGKSTLARRLGDELGLSIISSDRVRKELAGLGPSERGGAAFGAGIYTPEWNDRTYAACLARAEAVVAAGGRALVDASFRQESRRRAFLDAAVRLGARSAFLLCAAPPATIRARLAVRRGDVSDADVAVYERARTAWEEPSERTRRALHLVPSEDLDAAVAAARKALRAVGLADPYPPAEPAPTACSRSTC